MPFIVVTPIDDLRGVRVDAQVSSVDLFPTVLGLRGIDGRAEGAGPISLLPVMFSSGSPVETYAYGESMTPSLQFGWGALHSLRSTRYKLIQAPRPELFDLSADPGEETNIIERNPAVASRMKARLDRLMADTSENAPAPEAADLDQETLQRLAALGYVGGARGIENVRRGVAGRSQGQAARLHGRPGGGRNDRHDDHVAAARTLESALREDPGMPQALLMLGASVRRARPARRRRRRSSTSC